MKSLAPLALLTLMHAGCAHQRFELVNDTQRLSDHHQVVAEVTCTFAKSSLYTTLRDEFHVKAMPPRARWTAEFRVEQVIKGNITCQSFRITGARIDGPRYSTSGFQLRTNASYRVGFDRIASGEVRGLTILTGKLNLRNEHGGSDRSTGQFPPETQHSQIQKVVERLGRLKPGMTRVQVRAVLGELPLEDTVVWVSAGSDWGEGCDGYLLKHGYSLRLLWDQTEYNNWKYRRSWLDHSNGRRIEF